MQDFTVMRKLNIVPAIDENRRNISQFIALAHEKAALGGRHDDLRPADRWTE